MCNHGNRRCLSLMLPRKLSNWPTLRNLPQLLRLDAIFLARSCRVLFLVSEILCYRAHALCIGVSATLTLSDSVHPAWNQEFLRPP